MFEGVQDQFHQFLAAAAAQPQPPPPPPPIRASPNSFPLSFSLLHGSTNPSAPPSSTSPTSFPIFDAYPPPPQGHLPTTTHHHHHHILQPPLHHQFSPATHSRLGQKQQGEATTGFLSTSLVLERERSMAPDSIVPWSHDEVLALFRIRSAMENWFPEFPWEYVSRKMAEMGFKKSPQKCKEKFEEESRYLHTATATTSSIGNDNCSTRNYRLFSELEELYHHGHAPSTPPPPPTDHPSELPFAPRDGCKSQNDVVLEKQNAQGREQEREQEEEEEENELQADDQQQSRGVERQGERKDGQDKIGQERLLEDNDGSEATDHDQTIDKVDELEETKTERKKRRNHHEMKSKKKFEIFKSFCEEIVSKMMAQQEELHNKILEDIIKRDEENIARDEAWRKQEIERINKAMEDRARDQAIAGDRQAKIIECLKRFTSNSSTNTNNNDDNDVVTKPSYDHPTLSTIPILSTHQNPSSSATHSSQNNKPTSSNDESLSQTSNSLTTHIDPVAPITDSAPKINKNQPISRKTRPNKRAHSDNCSDSNDTGKRWPREEVLALINIRCSIDLNNNTAPDDRGQNHSNTNNNNSNTKNPPLWERISQRMLELGYKRSAKRCKEKWENINKYFRKTKDMNKKRSVDSRTCPYFHQLSHLYSQGRVMGGTHGCAGGSTLSEIGGGGSVGDATTTNAGDQGEDNAVQVTTSACDFEF